MKSTTIATLLAKVYPYRPIMYGALALGIITAASYGYHRWTTMAKDLELAQTKLQVAEQVNQSNQQTIKDLQEQRKRDSEALTGLVSDVAAIRRTTGATHSAIKNLGATNETVREYLQRPVPDDLRGVLNNRTPRPK